MKRAFHFASGTLAAGCLALSALIPVRAVGEVSEADFNALKEAVQKLSDKVQKLEQTHAADEQTHRTDQEQIKQLQEKLGETQTAAADAAKKAEIATQVQPAYRIPTDSGSVNKNFMILGDAEVQYAKFPGEHGTFLFADFAPIFLYRAGDKILFEAGFDFTLQNASNPVNGHDSGQTTGINLSFAQLSYLFNDYCTFAAGNMLLPLGTYAQRSAAGWVNKFPDDPLPRDLLPGTGVGGQLFGAVPIGQSGQLINYSIFGVNGPSSSDGTGNSDQLDLGGNVGLKTDNTVGNLHGTPSGGGRIGWFFPYGPHYDIELGISAMSGEWDDAGQHNWTGGAIDASVHVGPFFEVKGEYIRSQYGSDDLGLIRPRGWWGQAGYKLAGLNLEWPLINNFEVVGRWDGIHNGFSTHTERESVGLIYYFTNTLLAEGAYEFRRGNDPGAQGDVLLLQLGYGF